MSATPLARVLAPFAADTRRNADILERSAIEATSVRILSPGDLDVGAGTVVLAPGLESLAAEDALRVLTAWDRAGATAALLRRPSDIGLWDALDRQSPNRSLQALEVADSVRWEDLYLQVDEAIRAATYPHLESAESAVTNDLYTIAEALSVSVGGPVVIWDRDWRLLAYSETAGTVDDIRRRSIMERRAPSDIVEEMREEGVLARLWSGELLRLDRAGMAIRLAARVHAAGELLGSVWVHESEHPLGEDAADALRRAADLAGLQILRRRAQRDETAAKRREAAGTFLQTGDLASERVRPFAAVLAPPLTVLSIRPEPSDPAVALHLLRRMADAAATYIEAYRLRGLETVTDDTVHVLFSGPDDDNLRRNASRMFDQVRAEATDATVHAGTGITVERSDDVPRARQTADLTVAALAFTGADSRLATFHDLWPSVVLMRLSQAAETDWVLTEGPLGNVVRGAAVDPELLDTLLALFDARGVVKDAATSLDVHPNTIRYRLRRLESDYGVVLDDPLTRFAVEAQVRVVTAGTSPAGLGSRAR